MIPRSSSTEGIRGSKVRLGRVPRGASPVSCHGQGSGRSFVVFGVRSATIGGNRRSGRLLLHVLCARSFGIRIKLKTAQLNTNNWNHIESQPKFCLAGDDTPQVNNQLVAQLTPVLMITYLPSMPTNL